MYGLWLLTQLRSSRSRAAAKLSQGGPSILSREVLLYSICPLSFFPRSAHSPFVLSPTSTGGAKVGGHVLFSASAYSLAWTRARADLLSAVVGEGGGLNGVTASDEHDGTPWTAKRARHAWGGREGGGGCVFALGGGGCLSRRHVSLRSGGLTGIYPTSHTLSPFPVSTGICVCYLGGGHIYIHIHTYIHIYLSSAVWRRIVLFALLTNCLGYRSACVRYGTQTHRHRPSPITIAHSPPPDPRTACALIGTSAPPEPVVMFIGCILASLIAFVPVRTSAPIWALRPGNRCASRCPTAVWEMVNGIVQSVLGGVRGSLYQCCCSSSRPPSGCVCWPWLLLLDPRLSTLDSRILLLFPPPSHPLALSLSPSLSPLLFSPPFFFAPLAHFLGPCHDESATRAPISTVRLFLTEAQPRPSTITIAHPIPSLSRDHY